MPGLVRYDEVLSGEIRHALRFTVPNTQRAYVWPARHYASSITDSSYPPMGVRVRLRANFDVSTYSAANQVILKALKKYGMMLADNGSAWYLSGAPDNRWNNDDLHKLTALKGSDFEVVDVAPLMVDPNSGQALQSGVSVSVNPSSATVTLNTTRQFAAVVANSPDQTVNWTINGTAGNSTTGWVNATGLYTAPNIVPSPATITIQATSASTPSAAGTAAVTIVPPVSVGVSPASATVRVNRTQQFTSNTTVTWQVNGVNGGSATSGTISSSGRTGPLERSFPVERDDHGDQYRRSYGQGHGGGDGGAA